MMCTISQFRQRFRSLCLLFSLIACWTTEANAQYQVLSGPNGAVGYFVDGISGNNLVGGYWNGSQYQGFLYNGSSFVDVSPPLPETESFAGGLNGYTIVGGWTDLGGVRHGFIYDGLTYQIVDSPYAGNIQTAGSYIRAISGSNMIGYYMTNSYYQGGFIYDGTNYTKLLDPLASGQTYANGISGNTVVGVYEDAAGDHGYIYDGTNYTTLDAPGSVSTDLTAISDGIIVGDATFQDGTGGYYTEPFLYQLGNFTFLGDSSLGTRIEPTGVSGNKIVGTFTAPDSTVESFEYTIDTSSTATPEPGSIATLIGMGVAGTAILRRRRRPLDTTGASAVRR